VNLEDYRARAERFLAEHDREYLRHFAGHKRSYDLEAIHARHAELFTRAAVESLRAAGATAAGEDAARLRWLLAFAVEGRLGAATRELDEEIARREASLVLDVGGAAIPFRGATEAQMNDAHADRRAAVEAARLACTQSDLTPLRVEAWERARAEARALGWRDYASMWGELRALDLGAAAAQAAAFLASGEEEYREGLEAELDRTTGVALADARRSDVPRMVRAADLDEHYPPARLVGSLDETLAGLGIDVRAQPNVHVDVEPRPGKSPRAFCAPVRIPGEVHLVMSPFGGRDDYAALFHEGGHAEHYAHVDPELPFEFRHLGDNSVTEAFAGLFEDLTEDAAWLAAPDGEALAERSLARRRYSQRRYAAKLGYELALLGPGATAADYARALSDATGVAWPAGLWLEDVDPNLYVLCYLRAWVLAERLRRVLRARWGERWFAEREAGAYLRGLWCEGQRRDADELADALDGGGPLDLRALAGA
jgi:hypothetical protein